MSGWIDSHCHLDSLADPEGALMRAYAAGVVAAVTVGTDLASSLAGAQMAGRHPWVFATAGIHPHDASSLDEEALGRLEEIARLPGVVAIGEIGLDFHRNLSPPEAQASAFRSQLELAARLGKPVVLHVRDAFDQAFAILEEAGGDLPGIVFHCFSGDGAAAAAALELGGTISFAGNISYRRSEALREAAATVPPERLLVETDSPYLAPAPHRGKPNEPAFVAIVGAAVAQAAGAEVGDVARWTTQNARRVFGIPH